MLVCFHLPILLAWVIQLLKYAGMGISKGILETTLEEYRKQMSVNGTHPLPTYPSPAKQLQSTAYSTAPSTLARYSANKGSAT
jgi:hypothetical protein